MNNEKRYQNKYKRTPFGRIVKYSFIGFNIFYLIWILYMIVKLLIRVQSPITLGTLESASIGIPFLIIFIVLTWLCGNFILGLLTLFTRPKK